MSVKYLQLGDVCNVRRGTTITKQQTISGIVPVVGGGTKPTYFHSISNRDAGCITISGSGASAGYVNYWNEPIFASDCSTVEPRNNNDDRRFIYYYLQANQDYIYSNFRSGAAQPHVYAKDIATLKYPILDLSTQQKIVEKLDAIFAEIDKATAAAEANIKNVEALFQSYLTEVFRANKYIDELCNIGSFLKLEYGKGLDESDRKESGAYYAYGANGIKAKTDKFLFDKPSIIVGRKGSAGELSLVFDKFWPLDVTYYVTHDDDRTDLKYLYYGLMAQNLPKYAKGVKPGINRNDVYAIQMRLPPLIEQKKIALKFAHLSEKVNDLSAIYKNKIKSLSSIKKSVLLQAFNGELVKE